MADGSNPSEGEGMTGDSIAKWVAILGSIVALGQTCSSAVTGYWQSQIEQAKAKKDLDLQQLKDRSDLAKSYLELITGSQAQTQDRIMLLGALSKVEGHPLQKWASVRYKLYQGMVEQMIAAAREKAVAGGIVSESEREMATLTADIGDILAQLSYYKDDQEKFESLRLNLQQKSSRIGEVKARMTLASVREASLSSINPVSREPLELQITKPDDPSAKIVALSDRVTPSLLYPFFAGSAKERIDTNVPFLRKALQEFKVSDRRMLAVILATISIETPQFDAYEESIDAARAYEGRIALGNIKDGDGILFRGRGYLGITGRSNYAAMSERLGLGTRLVDFPNDAKSPEVAARIAVIYFTDRSSRIIAAVEADDFAVLRRVVTGGSTHTDLLTTRYRKLLSALSAG